MQTKPQVTPTPTEPLSPLPWRRWLAVFSGTTLLWYLVCAISNDPGLPKGAIGLIVVILVLPLLVFGLLTLLFFLSIPLAFFDVAIDLDFFPVDGGLIEALFTQYYPFLLNAPPRSVWLAVAGVFLSSWAYLGAHQHGIDQKTLATETLLVALKHELEQGFETSGTYPKPTPEGFLRHAALSASNDQNSEVIVTDTFGRPIHYQLNVAPTRESTPDSLFQRTLNSMKKKITARFIVGEPAFVLWSEGAEPDSKNDDIVVEGPINQNP